MVKIILILSLIYSGCSHQKDIKKETKEDKETFHLSYFGHCDFIEKNNENIKNLNISHPGLKKVFMEDSCRVARIHQYLSKEAPLCEPAENLSDLQCLQRKIIEMMEEAPLNEQAHLMLLGVGLNLIANSKKLREDRFKYTVATVDFTLLILESLAKGANYQNMFSDLKIKSLNDLPKKKWKNYHPQLSREMAFTKDDEFPIFLLYSRLFADNLAYEMIEKLKSTLFYLETFSLSRASQYQNKIFKLMQRYHEIRQLYQNRFGEICDANISSGCNQVGGLYLRSRENTKEALPYLTKSCSLLDGTGCGILGDYYLTVNDVDSSLRHYTLGCLYNNQASCDMAGTLHYDKNEKVKATSFFKTSCENQDDLGCLYLKGIQRKPKSKMKLNLSGIKGKWKGHYKCPQGETQVLLTIKGSKNVHFRFNKDGKQIGEFEGKIKVSDKTIYFNPKTKKVTKTIKGDLQNWLTIGFTGKIFPETIAGRINDPACETIYLEKL